MEQLKFKCARQRGVSLVELMISMTLGLIILSALVYVYTSSRSAYRINENLARVQESGRFALEYLSQDLRMSSYAGCRSRNLAADKDTLFNITANPAAAFDGSNGIEGFENGTGWTNPGTVARSAGDVMTVRRASSLAIPLTANTDFDTRTLSMLNNSLGIGRNDLVLLANCERAMLFRVTNNPPATAPGKHPTTLAFGSAGNLAALNVPPFNQASRAEVLRFGTYSFFVGRGPNGESALYRTDGSVAEAIVDGVIDMELQFALDDSIPADGVADRYLPASAIKTTAPNEWSKAIGVRVSLLVASGDDGLAANPMSYVLRDLDGDGEPDTETAPDRRLYQVFTTTIALRNRVL
ncbi:MAG: PilW family protein [Burkholderiaceae bacterium]